LVLEMSYPAVPSSVAAARGSVGAVAAAHGASQASTDAVRLAVSEAVTNVVQHAYRDGDGEVHITAAVVLGKLLVVVEDDGRGMAPDPDTPGLGFGLPLITRHSDRCVLASPPNGGVQLELRFDLENVEARHLAA
jgi:anti-sigma regulatory factor (Ser/Thr protein kinase)